ncbi:hypothetical protein [Sphingomonas sp.]|uniref:hypothetical protein n=1 Tax=Sphingomonas sp. TaxID=28214 RepID=UPI0035ADE6F1
MMNRFTRSALALFLSSPWVVTPAGATDLRLVLQTWNPTQATPDGLTTLVNQKDGVESDLSYALKASDGFVSSAVEASVQQRLTAALGTRLQEFQDPSFDVGTLRSVSIKGDGKQFSATVVVGNNRMNFKLRLAGLPDVLVKAETDATVTLRGHLGDASNPLVIDSAILAFSGTRSDIAAATTPGAAILDAAKIAGIPIRRMIATQVEQNQTTLDPSIFASINQSLRPAAARLAGKVAVGIWSQPGAVAIAFGPGSIALPRTGHVSGAIVSSRADLSCVGAQFYAEAQAGPARLVNPFRSQFTAPPIVRTPTVTAAGGGTHCSYSISGAVAGAYTVVHAIQPSKSGALRVGVATVSPVQRTAIASASNIDFSVVPGTAGSANFYNETNRMKPVGTTIGGIRELPGAGPVARQIQQQGKIGNH